MDRQLEQRVAALEEQVQVQPKKILLTLDGKTIAQIATNHGTFEVSEK